MTERDVMTESEGEMSFGDEPRSKECGQPLEARKGQGNGFHSGISRKNAVLPKS